MIGSWWYTAAAVHNNERQTKHTCMYIIGEVWALSCSLFTCLDHLAVLVLLQQAVANIRSIGQARWWNPVEDSSPKKTGEKRGNNPAGWLSFRSYFDHAHILCIILHGSLLLRYHWMYMIILCASTFRNHVLWCTCYHVRAVTTNSGAALFTYFTVVSFVRQNASVRTVIQMSRWIFKTQVQLYLKKTNNFNE